MPATIQSMLTPERAQAMRAAGLWDERTVLDDFDRLLAMTPDRLAIVDHNSMTGQASRLTYGELGRRVERIAAGLVALGVGQGDVVSWQLPNWWEFAALHLAAMRIGAISNPLMPIFRERELRFMLKLSGAKVLVMPRSFRGFDHAGMARGMRADLPDLAHVLVVGGEGAEAFEALHDGRRPHDAAAAAALFAQRRPASDDVIEVLYTSGTTGEPKGVMHSSNTLISNLVPYIRRLGLSGDDVVLMASPLAHQTGFLYGVVMPVLLGAPVILQDIWNAGRAADNIKAEGVTFTMASTPFLADLTAVAEERRPDLASLRIFLSAGAPIPSAVARRATDNLGATIVSAWGMTENGAATTTLLDDPPARACETDGRAMEGIELRVVDDAGQVLPAGAEGRLHLRGCSNFLGYLKRPELYGVDADGWFDTGDLARMDAEGYIRITGRTKDVIIRGGENVPVVEVEGLIYQHPAVAEVAVVGMPDARLGERACAFVVPRPGAALTLAELVAFLETHKLTRNYLPERLEVVDAMPRTPSGKIQKFRLRDMAREAGG
ncbi:cyclohexanecarboxylate-CoA ligase [Stella humosa]|uniref:3-methylmercaptopropionyl-CoA ligase n=1 Tax=Stella humosa TaxID=94 RepID=A0A3N1KWZ4_9PROT|nr:cyclohexanecarboxylate-CoA ligase [Stella humosa]ROP83737.1 cyclohexanecarboxylate-CoA ligase [Stella humosa]BBK33001.1 cyclohexanecarboxylate-CoA ligase [Stella humosa]